MWLPDPFRLSDRRRYCAWDRRENAECGHVHPGRWRNPGRPYGFIYDEDAVNVVGHDHEFVDCDSRKPIRQFLPRATDQLSAVIEAHFVRRYIAKKAEPAKSNYRDKVHPR